MLLACEGFSFDSVAILIKQGMCDYLSISKANTLEYNPRYDLECMSLTKQYYYPLT